ncbi:MAG: M14 family metallopeptidase [Fusobacterium sp.]|uniref:M14 family metallopeptidase n=1 Tax=Fusobacterium sp. TaxID=68766 RepID=UPI00294225A3|nr:M14 family metallopeptidase [Fusobacterium sp.]MDY3058450.1 M14 family metallopeptidase [Fusobacterium sp.]
MFKLGNITCNKGEKYSGFWKIDDYNIPVTVIYGKNRGKTICISAGIHNCEYTSIQTAIDLANEFNPDNINGILIILHTVNYSGFFKRVPRIVPEDNKNLNRVFPGEENGTVSEKIAFAFSKYLYPQLDFFIDLHGGDLFEEVMPFIYAPGIGEKEVIDFSHKVASNISLPVRVRSKASTGAYNSAAIQGVPSLLIEIGGNGNIESKNLDRYKSCLKEFLAYLEVIEYTTSSKSEEQKEITQANYLESPCEGYWYPRFKAGDLVEKDDILGEIKDCFGKELCTFRAEFDGIILYQTISLAIPKDDPLVAYGKLER